MYHLDAGESGNDTNEPSFNHMSKAWFSSTLDGTVYAEPLVDGGTGNGCGEVELASRRGPLGTRTSYLVRRPIRILRTAVETTNATAMRSPRYTIQLASPGVPGLNALERAGKLVATNDL
jgi:hypothetical protein